MAKHEVVIHENTSATKASAPYLGSYISKETVKSDAFAARIAERCGLPAIQVQAIIAGAFDEIEQLQQDGLVRVHLDGLAVCGIITGSFPTADAAFDPERNSLQLAVRLDDDVKNELADVVPAIVSDASVTKLRVDNVMDIEIPRPFNLIHGKHVFSVAGLKMVLGPLTTLVDAVPILNGIVGAAAGAVAFLLAAAGSLVAIGVAWVFYRPVLGVSLLAVAGACVALVVLKKQKAAIRG